MLQVPLMTLAGSFGGLSWTPENITYTTTFHCSTLYLALFFSIMDSTAPPSYGSVPQPIQGQATGGDFPNEPPPKYEDPKGPAVPQGYPAPGYTQQPPYHPQQPYPATGGKALSGLTISCPDVHKKM